MSSTPTPPAQVSGEPDRLVGDFLEDENGLHYAGTHLMIDMWGARHLEDLNAVNNALRDSVAACGARLLELKARQLTSRSSTAVAVLSESHLAIHCLPDAGYAAIDMFTCGKCDPHKAIPVLCAAFLPTGLNVAEQKRGVGYQ